jgi:hypothetical protein
MNYIGTTTNKIIEKKESKTKTGWAVMRKSFRESKKLIP